MSSKIVTNQAKYDFDDVMMTPTEISELTSRKDVNLLTRIEIGNTVVECVPIVASNMDRIGTIEMYKELSEFKIVTCFTKHVKLEDLLSVELDPNLYILSSGIKESEIEELENKIERLNPTPKMVCFDVANGYMRMFLERVGEFKIKHPELIVIAGNVVTKDILPMMASIGVDIVKVGIGSGSVCTTRLKAGVGYPQFSAIIDMVETARELKIKIMSDGGIKHPGDACKAFGAGADFVMVGGLLAGHDECLTAEEKVYKDEVEFYGSSSEAALDKYYGGTQRYRANEGKIVKVKRKGPVKNTLEDLLGGLRSGCTYMNAKNLKELDKAKFIVVRQQTNNMFNSH
jgi:GMP reductase